VQCRTGNLARAAGRQLQARGFTQVYVLGESMVEIGSARWKMLLELDSSFNSSTPVSLHPCNSGFPDWLAAGYPTTMVEEPWPATRCIRPTETGY
jgi:rhodanese-related sulfurtransferase